VKSVPFHLGILRAGLSNEWRQDMFGTPGGPPADADTDGDGQTNREEEVGGTDPMDENSLFTVDSAAPGAIRWSTQPGRLYDVFGTTNMMQSFTPVAPGLTTNSYTLVTDGFYRIQARRSQSL